VFENLEFYQTILFKINRIKYVKYKVEEAESSVESSSTQADEAVAAQEAATETAEEAAKENPGRDRDLEPHAGIREARGAQPARAAHPRPAAASPSAL
jgi:hypothetical protein